VSGNEEVRHAWSPIDDLPDHWQKMASAELANLASIWDEQSQKLSSSQAVREFHERMGREWAIETGIIEGLYTLDRGTTQLLIEKGIEASLIAHDSTSESPEKVAQIIAVQQEALEGVFQFVNQKRPLSKSYIKSLHQVMTRFQETVQGIDHLGNYVETALIRGDWKKLPNNPLRPGAFIHEYCPPEHVESEMDRLIAWHVQHDQQDVSPEVEAAWLHHRFTQIHPFQDGNGRIARALASLVMLRGRCFPLSVHRDRRDDYINALEAADKGDLGPLVALFVKIQKSAFLKALSISENVLRDYAPVQEVISAAIGRLQDRRHQVQQAQQKVLVTGRKMTGVANDHLATVAAELTTALRSVDRTYAAFAEVSDEANDSWFKRQIVAVANEFDYYADTRTFRTWARLKIREDRQTELVISIHSLGMNFLGLLAATAFVEFRDRDENGETTLEGPYTACREPFEFSYLDDEQTVEERFREWLTTSTLLGLDQWRRQL
jgi:Fic family protein